MSLAKVAATEVLKAIPKKFDIEEATLENLILPTYTDVASIELYF